MPQRIPDTTADERLTGLERFLEFWLGPRRPEYGEPPETLHAVELPEPLRRLYAFAGRWPSSPAHHLNRFSCQDYWLSLTPAEEPDRNTQLTITGDGRLVTVPPAGVVHRSGPYIVFVAENQGVWLVATRPSGIDPEVYVSEDCSHRTHRTTWRVLDKPLSHFLVTFILQETMLSSENAGCSEKALEAFQKAECHVEPLWENGEFAWPGVLQSYYLVDGRLLLRRDIGDMWFGGDWYGFNDPACADLLEKLGLPLSP